MPFVILRLLSADGPPNGDTWVGWQTRLSAPCSCLLFWGAYVPAVLQLGGRPIRVPPTSPRAPRFSPHPRQPPALCKLPTHTAHPRTPTTTTFIFFIWQGTLFVLVKDVPPRDRLLEALARRGATRDDDEIEQLAEEVQVGRRGLRSGSGTYGCLPALRAAAAHIC